MKYLTGLIVTGLLLTSCQNRQVSNMPAEESKQQLYSLEHKWLEYEFALDTAPIARFLHDDFISISATDTSNKQMELAGVYKNISAMKSDSIFIDSFKIEEPFIVKQFDNTAITIFITHTYKTAKGKHQEKRTKFYDVWRKVNGEWKAMSSQATVVEEIK
ncbi:MAG: nuclear transport factor 2 family protein [Sphingobacteriales bacterium]|nr:nuclear transport factor 2 family protein [Sphingobacteriales bacterium]